MKALEGGLRPGPAALAVEVSRSIGTHLHAVICESRNPGVHVAIVERGGMRLMEIIDSIRAFSSALYITRVPVAQSYPLCLEPALSGTGAMSSAEWARGAPASKCTR